MTVQRTAPGFYRDMGERHEHRWRLEGWHRGERVIRWVASEGYRRNAGAVRGYAAFVEQILAGRVEIIPAGGGQWRMKVVTRSKVFGKILTLAVCPRLFSDRAEAVAWIDATVEELGP